MRGAWSTTRGGGSGGPGGGGGRAAVFEPPRSPSTDVAVGAGGVERCAAASEVGGRQPGGSRTRNARRRRLQRRAYSQAVLTPGPPIASQRAVAPRAVSGRSDRRLARLGHNANNPTRRGASAIGSRHREGARSALRQARNMERPSPGDANGACAAWRGRAPEDEPRHMTAAAPRGAAEMARMSTSDRINNEQVADFMTIARASGAPGHAGRSARHRRAGRAAVRPRGRWLWRASDQQQSARSPEPYRPSVTERPLESPPPERSPDVRTRDQAWRRTGPHGNPRQDCS